VKQNTGSLKNFVLTVRVQATWASAKERYWPAVAPEGSSTSDGGCNLCRSAGRCVVKQHGGILAEPVYFAWRPGGYGGTFSQASLMVPAFCGI
jgi:hypothetical protein